MRLIDADKLKEKLLQMQKEIVPRGNTKSDTWKAAYLLVFDVFIKILDEMPMVTPGRDYCKNDCDAIYEAYTRGCSQGYIEGISNTLKGMRKEKKDE